MKSQRKIFSGREKWAIHINVLTGFFPAFLRLHYSGFFGRCFFSRESWRFVDLALFRGWIPQSFSPPGVRTLGDCFKIGQYVRTAVVPMTNGRKLFVMTIVCSHSNTGIGMTYTTASQRSKKKSGAKWQMGSFSCHLRTPSHFPNFSAGFVVAPQELTHPSNTHQHTPIGKPRIFFLP